MEYQELTEMAGWCDFNPMSHSKPLTLDVTVTNMFAQLYITAGSTNVRATIYKAASSKTNKYTELSNTQTFTHFMSRRKDRNTRIMEF